MVLIIQKTDSAERDKWTGCEGDLANLFLGNFSKVLSSRPKSGLSETLYDQQSIRISCNSNTNYITSVIQEYR